MQQNPAIREGYVIAPTFLPLLLGDWTAMFALFAFFQYYDECRASHARILTEEPLNHAGLIREVGLLTFLGAENATD